MNDADVGGLPAVLDDEPGLYHLQRVRDQSCSNTSQSSGKYGSPLRDVAQFIHVKVHKSGDGERYRGMYDAKGNSTSPYVSKCKQNALNVNT